MHVEVPRGRPRVVATDLDGTLLDRRGEVTARTRAALRRLWRLGIETVLVTARPPRWIDPLADLVGGHGVAICANGAFVYDVAVRQVTEVLGMAPERVRELACDIRGAVPGVVFAAELADGFYAEPNFPARHPLSRENERSALAIEQVAAPVGKLLARAPHADEEDFLARVVSVVGTRGIVAYSGAVGLAEIGPPGVTKASALRAWCTLRGIDAAQVWAFGDMPNDVPMLTWAGVSFAMANGHEQARAAASYTCPGNDDDGVARTLESIR